MPQLFFNLSLSMGKFFVDMLYGRLSTQVPTDGGRSVSFACQDADIRLATGPMRERVLGYLLLNGVPSMAREIAAAIGTNQSRVTKTLKDLVDEGEVEPIKHDGCVTEYALTVKGLRESTSLVF